MRFWIKIIVFVGSCAAALGAGSAAAGWMRGADGLPAGIVLLSERPLAAVVAVITAFGASVLLGLFAGRVAGPRAGLFIAGVSVLGFAARTGGATSVLRSRGESWQLLVEAGAWSFLILLASRILLARNNRAPRIPTDGGTTFMHRYGWLLGCAAVLPVVWMLARSELKGQTIAAACIASIAAGLIGQVLVHRERAVMFAAIPLVGGIGAIVATFLGGPLNPAQIPQGWSPFLLVMPQDYAAGAMVGGLVGILWADTILHENPSRSEPEAPVQPPRL